MMQYRDGRPNDPISMRVVGETPKLPMPILGQLRNRRGNYNPSNPFSGLTPDEIRRRMEYERNNPDEFRQTIMPVPIRQVGETPKLPMLTDTSAKELYPQIDGISAYPTKKNTVSDYLDFYKRGGGRRVPVDQPGGRPMPQPVLTPQPQPMFERFQPQPRQLGVSGDNNSAEASRQGQLGQQLQFGQVQQQPQFNQQGMQQMMQFMQQMMQMFSMMSGQGGQGGFGGGFNQRPPMFGGGYGGGMGGGFGQGGYQQFQQPQQRPMPRYPRMQSNFSQSPFGRY